MEVDGLFRGISVVIDDDIDNKNENIGKIVDQIETENIPLLKYSKLPKIETFRNFRSLSFLILDWRLVKDEFTDTDIELGVHLPSALSGEIVQESIQFLKKLRKVCFCPVFIFSNEDKDLIQQHLVDNSLYLENRPNQIFIKSKNELLNAGDFIGEVTKWITSNPSIYVLKEWEKEYQRCKNELFSDFHKLSPAWPSILWENFGTDGVNESAAIGDVISSNLHTRMVPYEFNEKIIKKTDNTDEVDIDEIGSVIEGERYIKQKRLAKNDISPGDLFKKGGKYYLNIRPSCDLIPRGNGAECTLDTVNLYLISGGKGLKKEDLSKKFNSAYGNFSENDTHTILFPVAGLKALDFKFKTLKIEPWNDWKDKRVGRILSPFINRVQQKFSLYNQRLGLPRTPGSLIPTKTLDVEDLTPEA